MRDYQRREVFAEAPPALWAIAYAARPRSRRGPNAGWRPMASSIKATPQATETPEKDVSETAPDSPLLDLSNAAVKKLPFRQEARLRHP
jgi:hypothetical protein